MTDIADQAARKPRSGQPRSGRKTSTGLIVALAATFAVIVAAAAFVALVLWPRWPAAAVAPDAPALPITVGGVLFNVPSAAIRMSVQRHAGTQARLDLAFLWPSLGPPDARVRPAPSEEPILIDRLFVTVSAQEGTLPPAERLKTIYPRYLADGKVAAPDGLVGVPFRDATPYQGEDLIHDAVSPERFVVRCTRPSAGPTPGTCLYERRIGAADITVRFPRDWLADWTSLAAGIERLIAGLRPAGS